MAIPSTSQVASLHLANLVGETQVDADGIPLKYPSVLIRSQGDYGENRAMLPRGLDNEENEAKDFLRGLGQKVARQTKDLVRLEKVFKDFEEPFVRAVRLANGWKSDVIPDALVSEVGRQAQNVLSILVVEFENESLTERASYFINRVKNLRKMLAAYMVKDGEALKAVILSQNTKSKDAWQKYLEYRDGALGLIESLDVEEEGTIHVEGFHATLLTAPRADWDDEALGKLQWILRSETHLLAKHGLSEAAKDLRVLAYPSKNIPRSALAGAGTFAMYDYSKDIMYLSVGNEPNRVLQTITHEIGHRVYRHMMGSIGRAAWEDFYEGNKGAPDVDAVLAVWDKYLTEGDWDVRNYGKFFIYFIPWAQKHNREIAAWAEIIWGALGTKEPFDPLTGAPKKGTVPGYDILKERKNEVKVFLKPVTSYSATSAAELFAEVFAHALVYGPQTIDAQVLDILQRAVPRMKIGSTMPDQISDCYWGDKDALSLQPDSGTGEAAVPRGLSASRVACLQIASASRKTKAGDFTVETWWEKSSRSYITQTKDAKGDDVVQAEYSGNPTTAKFTHDEAVKAAHTGDFDEDMLTAVGWRLKEARFRSALDSRTVAMLQNSPDSNPLDGLRKKKVLDILNRLLDPHTKGLFRDQSWAPIQAIRAALGRENIPALPMQGSGAYEKENGVDVRKVWLYEVSFVNQNGMQDRAYIRIVASGAGPVSDPLEVYDVVAYAS